jgi:hypothetical protein
VQGENEVSLSKKIKILKSRAFYTDSNVMKFIGNKEDWSKVKNSALLLFAIDYLKL